MTDQAKYQAYKRSGALEKVVHAVEKLIRNENEFVVDEKWWRHYLSFRPRDWVDNSLTGIIGFVFNSTPGSLRIQLMIYQCEYEGGPNVDTLREAWLKYAIANPPVFKPSGPRLNKTNNTIYSYKVLGSYSPNITAMEIDEQLRLNWKDFFYSDYPKLKEAIRLFKG